MRQFPTCQGPPVPQNNHREDRCHSSRDMSSSSGRGGVASTPLTIHPPQAPAPATYGRQLEPGGEAPRGQPPERRGHGRGQLDVLAGAAVEKDRDAIERAADHRARVAVPGVVLAVTAQSMEGARRIGRRDLSARPAKATSHSPPPWSTPSSHCRGTGRPAPGRQRGSGGSRGELACTSTAHEHRPSSSSPTLGLSAP